MADIKYQCPQCSSERMVSEFADATKIMCRDCDCNMRQFVPETEPSVTTDTATAEQENKTTPAAPPEQSSAKKSKLKLARDKQPELPPDEKPGVVKSKVNLPEEAVAPPLELHPKKKQKKPLISQPFLAFLLFLVVGGISGFLRYGITIEDTFAAPALEYLWIGVLVLHFYIVAKAFSSDMMQGILCFFIPGWSFIYLAISDHFYHKAIVFGLLVGIGYDGGLQLTAMASTGLGSIQEFINTGGGDVRRR